MSEEIIEFYSRYNEKDRLVVRHSLEKIRSQEIISRYLPSQKIRILDIGGAAGIYSFWLASLGHEVDLIDLVPKHIEQIKELEIDKKIKLNSAIVGNACDLPYKDNLFDIVLLMGPLYHLQEKEKRSLALSEAKRVLKPNGLIFTAAISKYASMLDGYFNNLIEDPTFQKILEKDILEGKHDNNSNNIQYFTTAFFHSPSELKSEMEEIGIKVEKVLPVEGFAGLVPEIEKKIEHDLYRENLLKYIKITENDQTIIGMSFHYLGIGKK